jgi:hypothetical protein
MVHLDPVDGNMIAFLPADRSNALISGFTLRIAEPGIVVPPRRTVLGDSPYPPAIVFLAKNVRIPPARGAVIVIALRALLPAHRARTSVPFPAFVIAKAGIPLPATPAGQRLSDAPAIAVLSENVRVPPARGAVIMITVRTCFPADRSYAFVSIPAGLVTKSGVFLVVVIADRNLSDPPGLRILPANLFVPFLP